MNESLWIQIVLILVGALAAAAGIFLRRPARLRPEQQNTARRTRSPQTVIVSLVAVLGGWLFLTRLLLLLTGPAEQGAVMQPILFFGARLSSGFSVFLFLTAGLLLCAVLLRILVIPRMQDTPGRLQLALEVLFGFRRKQKAKKQSVLKTVIFEIRQNARAGRDTRRKEPSPRPRRSKNWGLPLSLAVVWLIVRFLLPLLKARTDWGTPILYTPDPLVLFGQTISGFLPLSWGILFLLALCMLLLRLFFVPNLREMPRRFQLVMEFLFGFRPPHFRLPARKPRAPQPSRELPPALTVALAVKRRHRKKKLVVLMCCLGVWLAGTTLLTLFSGHSEKEALSVSLLPDMLSLGSFSINASIVITWIVMAILVFCALLLRLFFLPRMRTLPGRAQLILELAISGISEYTDSKVGREIARNLSGYIFTLAVFIIALDSVELFGIRPPTADITMTAGMALISFALIHGIGIQHRSFRGHMHDLASPTALVFPIRVLTEFAIPVSLACRLFGNTFGGMIVMDLLYHSLGTGALGIPSLAGLYFNVFHPLVQAFIFITLTLTFIGEAAEMKEA